MYEDVVIPTYIINLKERKDRLESVLKEFNNRSEFQVNVVEACTHRLGTLGLWNSIVKIIHKALDNKDDLILIVEDDHVFTEDYNKDFLFENIIEAYEQGADILLGGVGGGYEHLVPITENRFWVDHFWCTQFMIVYKRFFGEILKADFREGDTADDFISALTANKMVLFPFVSIQKDFGYSDVTTENNLIRGNITHHFNNSISEMEKYQKVFMLSKETENKSKKNILE